MYRYRPFFISVLCLTYFVFNLFPTAHVMTMFLGWIGEYLDGGAGRFHSAIRAANLKSWGLTALKVVGFDLAIIGLWCMKRWGLVMFNGFVAWGLFVQIMYGPISPIAFGLGVLALVGSLHFFYAPPKTIQTRPEVHLYKERPSSAAKSEAEAVDRLIY